MLGSNAGGRPRRVTAAAAELRIKGKLAGYQTLCGGSQSAMHEQLVAKVTSVRGAPGHDSKAGSAQVVEGSVCQPDAQGTEATSVGLSKGRTRSGGSSKGAQTGGTANTALAPAAAAANALTAHQPSAAPASTQQTRKQRAGTAARRSRATANRQCKACAAQTASNLDSGTLEQPSHVTHCVPPPSELQPLGPAVTSSQQQAQEPDANAAAAADAAFDDLADTMVDDPPESEAAQPQQPAPPSSRERKRGSSARRSSKSGRTPSSRGGRNAPAATPSMSARLAAHLRCTLRVATESPRHNTRRGSQAAALAAITSNPAQPADSPDAATADAQHVERRQSTGGIAGKRQRPAKGRATVNGAAEAPSPAAEQAQASAKRRRQRCPSVEPPSLSVPDASDLPDHNDGMLQVDSAGPDMPEDHLAAPPSSQHEHISNAKAQHQHEPPAQLTAEQLIARGIQQGTVRPEVLAQFPIAREQRRKEAEAAAAPSAGASSDYATGGASASGRQRHAAAAAAAGAGAPAHAAKPMASGAAAPATAQSAQQQQIQPAAQERRPPPAGAAPGNRSGKRVPAVLPAALAQRAAADATAHITANASASRAGGDGGDEWTVEQVQRLHAAMGGQLTGEAGNLWQRVSAHVQGA